MFWSKIFSKDNKRAGRSDLRIDDSYIYLANIIKIFIEDYGFIKSVQLGYPIDKDGGALPLYTYPAIEYLNSLDFSGKNIFEFGAGQSTLYWLNRGAKLVSVENNQIWIDRLTPQITTKSAASHQFIFASKEQDYINSINDCECEFDVIIIDGAINRLLCAENALNKIKKDNAMIILDNSDWHQNAAIFLKENLDFIQIDFHGFRPAKPQTSITSLFLSRDFKFIRN